MTRQTFCALVSFSQLILYHLKVINKTLVLYVNKEHITGTGNKNDPSNDAQKDPSKNPDAPRRPLGLTDILTLDSPTVPLQPTSKSNDIF